MKTYVELSAKNRIQIPKELDPEDNRFSESLVEYFLSKYTKEGDKILDPFAGLGTTLMVSQEMGRDPYGIEYDSQKTLWIKSQLNRPEQMMNGDSRKFSTYNFPIFDFSITSPPHMGHSDVKNPFTDYSVDGEGYESYLATLRNIYVQIREKIKPEGIVVVEVWNLKESTVTPLAFDVAKELSKVFTFEGESIICWKDGYDYGYDHSYALVFRNAKKFVHSRL